MPVIGSGGMGVSGWAERGAPLVFERVINYDPMLVETVASPT